MSFRKRITPEQYREVRLARISYSDDGGATCSCGWTTRTARTKVLEDRIDKHLQRRHGGRGFRF